MERLPLEIRIVKTTDGSFFYNKKPFKLFINGQEIENVKRFKIDLDKDSLVSVTNEGRSRLIDWNEWTYSIEYFLDPYEKLDKGM